MKLLDKLQRKFGNIYIPNLIMYIVVGNIIVFVFSYLFPNLPIINYLSFNRSAIFSGQIWRIVSFIFEPYNYSPIFMIISCYFYWMIGTQLERAWGGFNFNVFYFTGVIGTIIGGLITGYATCYYLNLSLFLAFAIIFPNMQFLLFFFIPIKAKYLAYVDVALLLWELIQAVVYSQWGSAVSIIVAFINIAIFFGGDFTRKIIDRFRYRKVRRNFKSGTKRWGN
ncbi:MAG: rhomboid family intramembrane serine protease [Oscillospiraceae bacterium]|nr:rhomboid family intramembrane serine protease [Oscillospiraceae bacterium]